MTILEVIGVHKNFGGLQALKDVNLHVDSGEILGLIGPNGAGKTTLFNILTGVLRPNRGQVLFLGRNITGMKTHRIVQMGLARTFQANRLFMNLNVLENIEIACQVAMRTSYIGDILGLPSAKCTKNNARQKAINIAKVAGLEVLTRELVKSLPHGYQRALGVAMGLAADPKILCLDEPVTGMNIDETQFMTSVINKIHKQGTTILIVEHAMRVIMSICERIIVLSFGKKIAEGTPSEIQSNIDVIEAYLGKTE